MSQAPDFGDLRSLLNTSPTPQAWEQLCSWLEEWTSEAQRQRIDAYIASYLKQWPDEARRIPKRWLKHLASGDAELPWLSVCRTVYLRGFRGREMRQYNKNLSDTWLRILRHPGMRNIRVVDLGSNGLGVEDVHALVHSSGIEGLEVLELQRNPLGDDLALKLQPPHPFEPTLHTLGLRHTELSEETLRKLPLHRWTALKHLDLYGNDLTDPSLRHVQEYVALESLNVGKNKRLVWSHTLDIPTLKHLCVERTSLDERALASILNDHQLQTLHAWGCGILNPRLAFSPNALSQCTSLNLGMNALGSALIGQLAQLSMPELRALNLHGASISDDDALALLKAPWFSTLKELHLGSNPLSSTTRRAIKQRASECDVRLSL